MVKKFFLLFLLLVSAGWLVATHADTTTVNDETGLFTTDQVQSLEQQAGKLDEKIKGRILIVTTISNSEEPRDFADNYLKDVVENDQNGSVLLLDMGQREIYISTPGNMIDYLTGSRADSTLDDVYDQMTNAAYYNAAKTYPPKSATYMGDEAPGGHYRVDEETGKITRYKVLTTVKIIIAVVLVLILSLVFYFVTVSRYQPKSGIYKYPFRGKSNVELTGKTDRLTSSLVTTRRVPKSPFPESGGGGSTAHSNGGGTFSGGGRSLWELLNECSQKEGCDKNRVTTFFVANKRRPKACIYGDKSSQVKSIRDCFYLALPITRRRTVFSRPLGKRCSPIDSSVTGHNIHQA